MSAPAYDALPHGATLDLQDALAEMERAHHTALRIAHDAICEAHDRLRQRLQVVAMGGEEPVTEESED